MRSRVWLGRVALGYVIRTQGRAQSGNGGKSPGAAQRNCAAMDQPTKFGSGVDEPVASNSGLVFVNQHMRECVACLKRN